MKKRNISIAFIIIGVLGFVWSQNQKKKYRVFQERISNYQPNTFKVNAQTGNEYLFSFWGNDEESGLQQWANMEFAFKIETQSGNWIKEDTISASESEEKGGVRRAGNGDDIRYTATRSENIIVTATLLEGDYLDLEVYENLPDKTYWFPVLFIAFFIVGLVLFLKARNAKNTPANHVRSNPKK
jgi:hypothetical protein